MPRRSFLITPNFKFTKNPKYNFWVMEDVLNSGQKYMLTKSEMEELRKRVSLALGIFKEGE